MNIDKKTEFTEDSIVAFLLGIGEISVHEEIRQALERDEELRAQVGFLAAMLPSAATVSAWAASRRQSSEETHAIENDSGDTHESSAASVINPDSTRSDASAIDEMIDQFDREGLSPTEISERVGVTRTLVELKLRRIKKTRKRNRD